jgi:hypothetical protein
MIKLFFNKESNKVLNARNQTSKIGGFSLFFDLPKN